MFCAAAAATVCIINILQDVQLPPSTQQCSFLVDAKSNAPEDPEAYHSSVFRSSFTAMPLQHTQRDASGRVISLLHDTNEMPTYESGIAHSFYSPYPQNGYRGNTSYPNTPDLTRSDSYDSQASGQESPLTPNSAYQEPLFSNGMHSDNSAFPSRTGPKDPSHFYGAELQPTLPPISSFHKVAGAMESVLTASPDLCRRSSNTYGTMPSASSSNPEDFHYRHSIESQDRHTMAVPYSEPAIHRSVESSDDAPAHRPALTRQPRGDDEKSDSSRKGNKSKTGIQKRYPCKDPTCTRTFTTSGHASRHAKIHEGLKPIPCTFAACQKRFTRQDNMKQHLETHNREKSRVSKQARRPSLAQRRQSASSRGSLGRFSTPRDTPPLMSPAFQSGSLLSPGLSSVGFPRPSIASRTPSGLDALAMVATNEQATIEQQEAKRHAEHFSSWPYYQQGRPY